MTSVPAAWFGALAVPLRSTRHAQQPFPFSGYADELPLHERVRVGVGADVDVGVGVGTGVGTGAGTGVWCVCLPWGSRAASASRAQGALEQHKLLAAY